MVLPDPDSMTEVLCWNVPNVPGTVKMRRKF